MAGEVAILIVEDDASMRRAIGRLLEAAGLSFREFESAGALLESPDLASATCVVTDINLPTMSGFELVDTLRQKCGPVPAVFVTAFDRPGVRERAATYPNAAYLTKPFQGDDLLTAIRVVSVRPYNR